MSILFVYGTLKRNMRSHHILANHKVSFLRESSTQPKYHLYNLGWFPGMVIDEDVDGGVKGELYEVTDDCIKQLDVYEGIPNLFDRKEIELEDSSKAISYLYMNDVSLRTKVEDGVWK